MKITFKRRKGSSILYPVSTTLTMSDQRKLEGLASVECMSVSEYLRKTIKEHLQERSRSHGQD